MPVVHHIPVCPFCNAPRARCSPGRTRPSFVSELHWRTRPWPPRDKWGPAPGDAELGLLAAA